MMTYSESSERADDREDGVSTDNVRERLIEHLRQVNTFDKRLLREEFGSEMGDQEFGLLLHSVMERLVEERRVFHPQGKSNGLYKLASADGTARRAQTFGRTAIKKVDRAANLARKAAEMTDDPDEKKRFERSALKQANRAVNARIDVQLASRPRPRGL